MLRPGSVVVNVVLRPMTETDREIVADLFERLSDESRTSRFLQPMPRVPSRFVDQLAAVGDDHLAWVAVEDGVAVAVAECHRLHDVPSTCEVAVTVSDEWQRRGIGRRLVRRLARSVAEHGFTEMAFTMDPGNRASAGLARSLGAPLEFHDGMLTGVAPMRAPGPAG
jgi:L-amino acid N-acyltransferase YncA